MSKNWEMWAKKVEAETMIEIRQNNVYIRHAVLMFRPDFVPDRTGKTSLAIAIPHRYTADLRAMGLNVSSKADNNGGETVIDILNCKLNYNSNYPPTLVLKTEFEGQCNRTSMDISYDVLKEYHNYYFDDVKLALRVSPHGVKTTTGSTHSAWINVLELTPGGQFGDPFANDDEEFR